MSTDVEPVGPPGSAAPLDPRAPELTSPPAASEPPRRPLTGGAVMSAASRISVAVTGATATIVVARVLGASGAGAYAVAQTVIVLLTVLTTLGVEHGIAYYVSSSRWSAAHAHRSSQWFALASGTVAIALGLGARLAIPSAFHGLSLDATLAAVLALPFALSWFYGSYVALAVDAYEAYVLPPAIQSSLALVLVASLAVLDGVRGAIVGFSAAHAITAVGMLLARRRRPWPASNARERRGQLRRAMSFGVKGYASNALQFVNYRLDLLILNASASSAAVGHYSVAVAVTSVMWLLPQALSDVLFPRIAALSAGAGRDEQAMRSLVETKSLRHTVLLTLVVGALLALALITLVVPVYGGAFRPSIALGLILLPGVALLGLTGPISATILGRGHPKLSLINAAIVTPLTVALYAFMIPPLHATGAALASSLSYASTFLVSIVFYRRVIGRPVAPRLIPTRAELIDYRALLSAVLARLANRRSSARHG